MTWFLADTRKQVYWDEVIKPYAPKSTIGRNLWKNMQPYLKGEEEKWENEIELLSTLIKFINNDKSLNLKLDHLFSSFLDIRSILERVSSSQEWKGLDPLIDGFHIKQFLWFSFTLSQHILKNFSKNEFRILKKTNWYQMTRQPWESWLKLLQPKGDGQNYFPNFAVNDIDDDKVRDLRKEKRNKIRKLRELEKYNLSKFGEKYGVTINFERYLILSYQDERIPLISSDINFQFIYNQGDERVYYLLFSEQEKRLKIEIDKIEGSINTEEENKMVEILEQLINFIPIMIDAHKEWAKFEILYKKARMAIDLKGTKPSLNSDNQNIVHVKNAVHPHLNRIWEKKQQGMKPITLDIVNNVNVLYGANMSGKTIILRSVGLLLALAQHGFFVPAKEFRFSFVSHLTLITGDHQDIDNGLSSFGAEMVRVGKDLSIEGEVFFLIDEVGRGTNPIEGEAIAIAILQFLKQKKGNPCLLVTHFPNVIQESGIKLFEVKDYQLNLVEKGTMVFEAISIAEELGMPFSIISNAKKYLHQLNVKEK